MAIVTSYLSTRRTKVHRLLRDDDDGGDDDDDDDDNNNLFNLSSFTVSDANYRLTLGYHSIASSFFFL
jgi:hypothetical protein